MRLKQRNTVEHSNYSDGTDCIPSAGTYDSILMPGDSWSVGNLLGAYIDQLCRNVLLSCLGYPLMT